MKPILDSKPTGRPVDYSYQRIMQMKPVPSGYIRPATYKNPYAQQTAPRDQDFRGTCFSPNTRILMEDLTFKKISRVVVGDYVISHIGEKRLVTETMQRKWQGTTIKLWIYGYDRPIEGTKEHPVLTTNGWTNLGDITKSDYVAVPTLANIKGDKTLRTVESDPDFLWVLGLYLAEGSLEDESSSGGRVTFSLHRNEVQYAERVRATMAKFGTTTSIRERETNGLTVQVAGQVWVDIFRELGGEYCHKKKLATRLMYLPPELQKEIYDGWCAGDGHENSKHNNMQTVSTSETLIRQMQIILMRNGKKGNIQRRTEEEGKRPNWVLETAKGEPRYGYFEDGYYWVRPRKIEKVSNYMSGQVYNLEVDTDNSYIAESVAVHNCVGQSTAYCYDLLYMTLTKDLPTPADMATFKKNVVDSIGTTHDVLYPQSASAECFYQMSRYIGNITYPAGSETRFAARAWIGYGMVLENNWHTDKKGTMVWMYPPGARVTSDGGISDSSAATFAALHRAEGWAMVGDQYGNASWDELCDAIAQKTFVLAGIPVYENYGEMQGGDGTFPEPRGSIAGYHALCFYGYDDEYLYLLHSWGEWCGRFGKISKSYFQNTIQESVYLVVLDSADVKIARGIYQALMIGVRDNTTKLPLSADLTVDGIAIGKSPQTIAVEPGKIYQIGASYPGYVSQKKMADGSVDEITFDLDVLVEPKENWFTRLIKFLQELWNKLLP